MGKAWKYKVVKSQRGMQGQWFSYPAAATFEDLEEAKAYAEEFAAEQRAAGVAGTRINVFSRKKFDGPYGRTDGVAEYKV